MTKSMHIRLKFLEAIRNGSKKHEYRLATQDRRLLKVGDHLLLVANEDENTSLEVEITKVELFTDFKNALLPYWEIDFKETHNDFSKLVKECESFYPKEDIDRFGVIVFEIENISK